MQIFKRLVQTIANEFRLLRKYFRNKRQNKQFAKDVRHFCLNNLDDPTFTHNYGVCTTYVWYKGPFRIVFDKYKEWEAFSVSVQDGTILKVSMYGHFILSNVIQVSGDFTMDDILASILANDMPFPIPEWDYGGH